jgi:hypothetical protein
VRTPSPSPKPFRPSRRRAAHRDATIRQTGVPLAKTVAGPLWLSRYAFAQDAPEFAHARKKEQEEERKRHHVLEVLHRAEEDEVRAQAAELQAQLPSLQSELANDDLEGVVARPMLSAFLAVTDAIPRIRRSTLTWGSKDVYFSMRLLHSAPDLVVWLDCIKEVEIEVVLTFSVFGHGAHNHIDEVSRFLTPQDTSCHALRDLAHFLTPVPQSWGSHQNGYIFFALAGHPPVPPYVSTNSADHSDILD